MNNTAQYAICQAVAALLADQPALGDGGVRVQRRRPMPQAVVTQVFVFYDESQPVQKSTSSIVWKTRVRIECVARDAAGASADQAADDLLQAAYARILADRLLGGLATNVEPVGLAISGDEADTALCAGQLLVDITHRCSFASIA